jgi:ABC-type Fe3+ transport system permease subunit
VIRRVLPFLFIALCWACFLLAIGWPTVAFLAKTLISGESPTGGWQFSTRQCILLLRSAGLAILAVVLCLGVSLPAAYAVGASVRISSRPFVCAMMLACLLCSPMVFAFGWDALLGSLAGGKARCVLVWALWAWPIPALLVGLGWNRGGRQAFEAGILETSSAKAFLWTALPLLRWHVAAACLILFILFFTDYSVPHACGLTVYATELLGWAASSKFLIDTLWPALLPTGIVIILLAGLCVIGATGTATGTSEERIARPPASRFGGTRPVLACFVISWLLPMGALLAKSASLREFAEAWRVYGGDIITSLMIAVAAGFVVMTMGLGLSRSPRLWRMVVLWTVLFGVLPGALIGKSLIAAYIQIPFIYDHPGIIVLSDVARFAWLGIAVVWATDRSTPLELLEQARCDGADRWALLTRIHLPLHWPALAAGVAMAGALSLSEVASSALVQVPAIRLVPHIIIEKFHRQEDEMLVSLSLSIAAVGFCAALLVGRAIRRESVEGWKA